MELFSVRLFFGFPCEEVYLEKLNALPPDFVKLFIQESDTYLREVIFQDTRYVGKFIGKITDLNSLELLEANIYSILKKIVPEYSYAECPLILFPAVHVNEVQEIRKGRC